MAMQWFCILKQQCVLWMVFLFRSQLGYRKVLNVHTKATLSCIFLNVKYFHSCCAWFIRSCAVQIMLNESACEPAICHFHQVRLLREMKRPHTEHSSASEHVIRIRSLVRELMRDPPF